MIEKLVKEKYSPIKDQSKDYLKNADFSNTIADKSQQRSVDYDCDDGNSCDCDSCYSCDCDCVDGGW